jgi:opacity protein-like surface antigen
MKLSVLIASILLISTTSLFAQNSKKSAINILAGPSFPIADFGNKFSDNPKAGLAKLGAFLAVEYDYQLAKDIYLTGRLSGSIHGIDFEYGAPTGSSLNMSTTNWKNANLFAGFSYMPQLTNRLNFIARAIGGYQYTSSPEVKINISGSFNGSSTQESVGASSFGMLFGLGFNYEVTSDIGLRIIADYGNANPKFEVTQSSGNVATSAPSSQKIEMVNLGVGISFKL